MDVIKAFKMTLDLAENWGLDNVESDQKDSYYGHLVEMYNKLVTDLDSFSEDKRNRWLGLAQASVYSNAFGNITLEQLKQINKDCA